MSRKRAVEPDDAVELSEPVTPEQRQELYERGFRSAWPSTRTQAEAVLQRLRSVPAGPDQSRDNAPVTET